MAVCSECKMEKPNSMVKLGVCDDCFNNPPSFSQQYNNDQRFNYESKKQKENIIITTANDVPNRQIESIVSIVASEAALGLNIFRDIANNWRDFVGGRASTAQKALKEAREACLDGLKAEAAAVGADAVIAIDLDYNEISTSGPGGILFVAASGTAVKLKPSAI